VKLVLEVELGNEAMRSLHDVREALNESLLSPRGMFSDLREGEEGSLRDINGNTVGRWEVQS
jgi:hypothetical protein